MYAIRRDALIESLNDLMTAQENLSPTQNDGLLKILMKYREHFTSRPGLYKGQPYEFELNDSCLL
jgi:hypothetical protein